MSKEKGKRAERELANRPRKYEHEFCREKNGRFKQCANMFLSDDEIIYCFNSKGELLFFTEINQEQYVKCHVWCKLADGYSGSMINGKVVAVHRVLTCAPEGMIVDHINGNKKDNRISNLRVCNKSENAYNSKLNSKNTSGYKGVYFRKDTQKWAAEIKHYGKKISLGSFLLKNEAVKARELAEEKYAKEFRRNI